MLARAVALEAAGRAAGEPPVAVLPPPWYGFSLHHMRFPGTVTLGSETFILMVKDICRSLISHGFRRILLLNGHGWHGGILDVIAADLGHEVHGRPLTGSAACVPLF